MTDIKSFTTYCDELGLVQNTKERKEFYVYCQKLGYYDLKNSYKHPSDKAVDENLAEEKIIGTSFVQYHTEKLLNILPELRNTPPNWLPRTKLCVYFGLAPFKFKDIMLDHDIITEQEMPTDYAVTWNLCRLEIPRWNVWKKEGVEKLLQNFRQQTILNQEN